jgi:hypothetical protein
MRNENIHYFDDPFGPTTEEVEEWARREHERRERWLQGPTDEEKRMWASRERQRRVTAVSRGVPPAESPLEDPVARRMMRDAELLSAGAASWVLGGPFWVMSQLMRSGRALERESMRARRVAFPEDDDL